jgi:hypothetical protein
MSQLNTNFFPLGRIAPVPGAPVGIFENFPALAAECQYVNFLLFQSDPANYGRCYIGSQDLDAAFVTGINYVLPAPGDSFSIGHHGALNVLDASKIRIDVEYAKDGVFVSIVVR